jgi:UDP-N-acetylglucosamine 2-epimerase (non-hydrolysing)
MPLVDLIAGARPNFVKIAPIIHEIQKRDRDGSRLSFRLIHTGQHYDPEMSADFFDQLGLPDPDVNLEAGAGSPAMQTGRIMARYGDVLANEPADICVVVGDVLSTMACALTARRRGLDVAHVEAGLRSHDWAMPEEFNRVVTDAVSSYFFTTSETAGATLRSEGVKDDRIFFVGNTMIDTLMANMERLSPPPFWELLSAKSGYFIATLHRPENVDDQRTLCALLGAISVAARGHRVIFPIHPRTRKTLCDAALPNNILVVDPQPYLQFNFLVKHAKAVITDSGGVTEEATLLGVPCMTLRNTTERPETVVVGSNELLGTAPEAIGPALDTIFDGRWKRGGIPERWDGKTAVRIVRELERILTR